MVTICGGSIRAPRHELRAGRGLCRAKPPSNPTRGLGSLHGNTWCEAGVTSSREMLADMSVSQDLFYGRYDFNISEGIRPLWVMLHIPIWLPFLLTVSQLIHFILYNPVSTFWYKIKHTYLTGPSVFINTTQREPLTGLCTWMRHLPMLVWCAVYGCTVHFLSWPLFM